jgi:hypothetical protein
MAFGGEFYGWVGFIKNFSGFRSYMIANLIRLLWGMLRVHKGGMCAEVAV